MLLSGIVIGAFIGFATLGFSGAIAGGFVGWLLAMAVRSTAQRRAAAASASQAQAQAHAQAEAEAEAQAGAREFAATAETSPFEGQVTDRRGAGGAGGEGGQPPVPATASSSEPIATGYAPAPPPATDIATNTAIAAMPADALAALDRRVRAIEARLGMRKETGAPDSRPTAPSRSDAVAVPEGLPLRTEVGAATSWNAQARAAKAGTTPPVERQEGFVRGADGTMQTPRMPAAAVTATRGVSMASAPPAYPASSAPGAPSSRPPGASPSSSAPATPPMAGSGSAPATPPPNALWAWFTGGNVLTRIGVVALFFGVAFLLKDFAQFLTVPVELRLLAVGIAGAGLVGVGARLARSRPGYGVSLEGAGAGILYLTIFAAFRLYDVLPAWPAFALLVTVAALTVWLAVRADSQPLAGLAIAGGFLAPFLVATTAESPVRLFGYFAVLNGAIFALAWIRAWRALNVVGFVFTFVLGLFWGDRFYRPEHFATVEPFLVLFFFFYVTIAILYAARGPLKHKAPVDGLLVFGVPLVGFALQAALVQDMRYGAAWSAVAVAVFYAVLAAVLARRPQPGLALLARAFVVLAIIFATIAIPFAVDARWTSAWWALEAAAVYWIGCRQRQGFARLFAIVLQVGASVAFVWGGVERGGMAFANATFLGTTMIALAALATVYLADRYREAMSAREYAVLPLLLAWGLVWWYGGGVLEVMRALPSREEGNGILAFVVASVAVAWLVHRGLRWPRLVWFGAALLPAMAVAGALDWDAMRTTLRAYGWLVWPLAWVAQWAMLHALESLRDDSAAGRSAGKGGDRWLGRLHATSAIAFVVWIAWEASEWVGQAFPEGSVWMPCAAAWPAIAYLWLVTGMRDSARWPWVAHHDAYAVSAGTVIAALLGAWFVIVNGVSPGDTTPLPYLPLLNPLDITLVATLAVLFQWARIALAIDERTAYAWWGAAVFLLVNALVFRAVHQWLDVPWRWTALAASKPLQAALTLTWTAVALPLMLVAGKRAIRPLWMVGAALLAVVVVKLFLLDLSALSGLPRIAAFLGVGVLLLIIGYAAPLPPAAKHEHPRA